MNESQQPSLKIISEMFDPKYWAEYYKGTKASIHLPAYQRYLQGFVSNQHAIIILMSVSVESYKGNKTLQELIDKIENDDFTKSLNISFESYFSSLLLVNIVSEVEYYISNVVGTVLRLYPEKMSSHTFKLADVLRASTKDELIERAANIVMNNIMYQKPSEYLNDICELLSIDAKKIESDWSIYVEIKARRDLGVHNNWIVNEIYSRKVSEIGLPNVSKVGDRLIADFDYLQKSSTTCYELVKKMNKLLIEKWSE